VPQSTALHWLSLPLNPNGRSNSDVVRPYKGATDIVRKDQHRWIVDFGVDMPLNEAALYEVPFEYVQRTVRPERAKNKLAKLRDFWWLHWNPRPEMRAAIQRNCKKRYLVTPHVSKHRIFAWLPIGALPSNLLIAFAREDDYFFGVLQSKAQEVWALRVGTWMGVGNDPRYTPTTCFETFPLPWPPGTEPVADPRVIEIGAAAKELDERRNAWLNPANAIDAELKR
jgi:hypothetical protein